MPSRQRWQTKWPQGRALGERFLILVKQTGHKATDLSLSEDSSSPPGLLSVSGKESSITTAVSNSDVSDSTNDK